MHVSTPAQDRVTLHELILAARHLPHLGAAVNARRASLPRLSDSVQPRKCSNAPVDSASH
jgi:hypothetical protein